MKKKLYLDFDGVIVDSVKRITEKLNHKYKKQVHPNDIYNWNFNCNFPTTNEEIEEMFDSIDFFVYLEKYFMKDFHDVIDILSQTYDITIVSIGKPVNTAFKTLFVRDNLPQIKNMIMITQQDVKMDKSIIRMEENSVFIDDCVSNLDSSSAGIKILFAKNGIATQWNNFLQTKYIVAKDWLEVLEVLGGVK